MLHPVQTQPAWFRAATLGAPSVNQCRESHCLSENFQRLFLPIESSDVIGDERRQKDNRTMPTKSSHKSAFFDGVDLGMNLAAANQTQAHGAGTVQAQGVES